MKPGQRKPYTSRIVLIMEHTAESDEEAREQRTRVIERMCEAGRDGVTVPVIRDGMVHQTWLGRPYGHRPDRKAASQRGPIR